MTGGATVIDDLDRRLIAATQDGLPLVRRPYDAVGDLLGITGEEVRARLSRMINCGAVRRIGAVPNHYALGLSANGMSVWDIDDAAIDHAGRAVGALDWVSHCYQRPRRLPLWPYNLFAMVHGRRREEVEGRVAEISGLLGASARAHDILYSTRILKKTGMRIAA